MWLPYLGTARWLSAIGCSSISFSSRECAYRNWLRLRFPLAPVGYRDIKGTSVSWLPLLNYFNTTKATKWMARTGGRKHDDHLGQGTVSLMVWVPQRQRLRGAPPRRNPGWRPTSPGAPGAVSVPLVPYFSPHLWSEDRRSCPHWDKEGAGRKFGIVVITLHWTFSFLKWEYSGIQKGFEDVCFC